MKPATQRYWYSQESGKVISLAEYREAKQVVEEHQSLVLNFFDHVSRLMRSLFLVIFAGSVSYILAQLLRWYLI
jgi:hypothetical protein